MPSTIWAAKSPCAVIGLVPDKGVCPALIEHCRRIQAAMQAALPRPRKCVDIAAKHIGWAGSLSSALAFQKPTFSATYMSLGARADSRGLCLNRTCGQTPQRLA